MKEIPQETIDTLNKITKGRLIWKLTNKGWFGSHTVLNIECQVCGYKQRSEARNILKGSGCRQCSNRIKATKRATPLDVVINNLDFVSKNLYTWEFVNTYTNIKTKIKCNCLKCNNVWVTNYVNLVSNKYGCPVCGLQISIDKIRRPLDKVLQMLDSVSSGFYSYKLKNGYKNKESRVECKCNICGHEWETNFYSLTRAKTKCPVCSRINIPFKICNTLESVYETLCNESNGRYEFKITDGYKSQFSKIKCVCIKCGYEWDTNFKILKRGVGCARCAGVKKYTSDEVCEMLNQVCNGRYNFDLTLYKNIKSPITCKCNKCGNEWVTNFICLYHAKSSCPNLCYKQQQKVSKPEHEIVEYIKQNFPQLEIQQSVKSILKNPQGNYWMELDIYIPELKLAFEFNGIYWHSDEYIVKKFKGKFESAQAYHDYKTEQCKQKGIELIHINELDYKKNQNNVLVSILNKIMVA